MSPYVQVEHLLVYPNCVKTTQAASGPGFSGLMNALRATSNRSRLTSPIHATAVALIPRCLKTHHYVASEFLKKTHFVGGEGRIVAEEKSSDRICSTIEL